MTMPWRSSLDIDFTYGLQTHGSPGIWKAVLGNSSTNSIVYARAASPVNVVTGLDTFNTGIRHDSTGIARPDVILRVPVCATNPNVVGEEK